jgi:hypothetical protein
LVGIVDVDAQHAGHVMLGIIVVREVHGQIPEVGKGVGLVVVLGPEAEPLVVLDCSCNIDDAEDGFVADDANWTTRPLDLEIALAVHPIDAVVTNPNVGFGPETPRSPKSWRMGFGIAADM